jgi:hypothetical protein
MVYIIMVVIVHITLIIPPLPIIPSPNKVPMQRICISISILIFQEIRLHLLRRIPSMDYMFIMEVYKPIAQVNSRQSVKTISILQTMDMECICSM